MIFLYIALTFYIGVNQLFITIYYSDFLAYNDGSFNSYYTLCTDILENQPKVRAAFNLFEA